MADEQFHLVSNYAPTGDQPQAIEQLVEGVERGDRCQTLLEMCIRDRRGPPLLPEHRGQVRPAGAGSAEKGRCAGPVSYTHLLFSRAAMVLGPATLT